MPGIRSSLARYCLRRSFMERKFPEADWRKLRALYDDALARLCTSALSELRALLDSADTAGDAHETYLEVYEHLNAVDSRRSTLFDDLRRSTAYFALTAWVRDGLLTDEELASFSADTREVVQQLLDLAASRRADEWGAADVP
jgi:hypothetical protein